MGARRSCVQLICMALVGSKWDSLPWPEGPWTAPHRVARRHVVYILFYASSSDSSDNRYFNT